MPTINFKIKIKFTKIEEVSYLSKKNNEDKHKMISEKI